MLFLCLDQDATPFWRVGLIRTGLVDHNGVPPLSLEQHSDILLSVQPSSWNWKQSIHPVNMLMYAHYPCAKYNTYAGRANCDLCIYLWSRGPAKAQPVWDPSSWAHVSIRTIKGWRHSILLLLSRLLSLDLDGLWRRQQQWVIAPLLRQGVPQFSSLVFCCSCLVWLLYFICNTNTACNNPRDAKPSVYYVYIMKYST